MSRSHTYPENAFHNGSKQQYGKEGSIPVGGTLPHGAIPSDAVPAINSHYPNNNTQNHNHHHNEVPRTYEDFMKDLQSRGTTHQVWLDASNLPKRPHSYHSHSQRRRSKKNGAYYAGYESDAGYRSEGVQSEILYTKKHQTVPGGYNPGSREGGYSSDWDAHHHHSHRHRGKAGGYTSDLEAYSRPPSRHHHRHNVRYDSGPLPTAHYQGVHNVYNNSYPANTGGGGSSVSVSHSTSSKDVTQNGAGYQRSHKQESSYNNVPFTGRTTIRNDEMYEQDKKKNKKKQATPSSATSSREMSSNSTVAPTSASNVSNAVHRVTPPTVSDHGVREITNSNDRHSVREATIKEEGSSDDDQYRDQLLKASVRLQKSPSDPHKNIQVGLCQ